MYNNGQGVRQSYSETAKWWLKAANQGDASAQYNLGILYVNGQGVQQSDSEAAKWWLKAANQSYASAQYNLGFFILMVKVFDKVIAKPQNGF